MLAYQATPNRGLSPRVRGNLNAGISGYPEPGSIPACAGEPRWPGRYLVLAEVYPRVCGGTSYSRDIDSLRGGLSPRVRGNLLQPALTLSHPGSIPACAGEPPTGTWSRFHDRVYPRVCGGTITGAVFAAPAKGLSPRVRGNHNRRGLCGPGQGSIPACAGEPCWRACSTNSKRVYPRVCGGTVLFIF